MVGIDVSKRHHDAFVDGERLRFSHTQAGFGAFDKWLKGKFPDDDFMIGMEPTGKFTVSLSGWLSSKGYRVVMVPGVYVNKARSMGFGRNKTDLIDAEIIADLLRFGKFTERPDKSIVFRELRAARFSVNVTLSAVAVWAHDTVLSVVRVSPVTLYGCMCQFV